MTFDRQAEKEYLQERKSYFEDKEARMKEIYEKYPFLNLQMPPSQGFISNRLVTMTYELYSDVEPIPSVEIHLFLSSVEKELNKLGSTSTYPFEMSAVLQHMAKLRQDQFNRISIFVRWKIDIKHKSEEREYSERPEQLIEWKESKSFDDFVQEISKLLDEVVFIYFGSFIHQYNEQHYSHRDSQLIRLPLEHDEPSLEIIEC